MSTEKTAIREVNTGGPLQDVRVLDLGNMIAGPFCARLLGDFGAEVIKVELPSGDPLRGWRTQCKGKSLFWSVQSRNKKLVTLNLRDPAGQELALRLAALCDIAVENFRPGTLEKWNLGYDRLSHVNPGVILVRISGFGQTGPYRDRAGFASVAEAQGGLRYVTGYPNQPPPRIGISLGDELAGLYAAYGALMALHWRTKTGKGQCVDVALTEAIFSLTEDMLPAYDKLGEVRERTGAVLPGIAPSSIYPTKDGGWIVIGANADNVFRRLVQLMGNPELATDPRFVNDVERARNQTVIDGIISQWTMTKELAELTKLLAEAGVPASKVYSVADIASDPQFVERDMILEVAEPDLGSVKMPGIVPRLEATPGKVRFAGKDIGADNREVYCGMLGLTNTELQALHSRGVI